MPRVSAVVSTTRGTSLPPAADLLNVRTSTASSSGKPPSLCMPGVLIEGGPRGLDEERACRLRPAEGASLRGSAWGPSECIIASTIEDMAVLSCLELWWIL